MNSIEHKLTMAALTAAEFTMRKFIYGLIWLTE